MVISPTKGCKYDIANRITAHRYAIAKVAGNTNSMIHT